MKATGIIRRVDDLGRIVIPKEIRRNLQIKEGDPLEIYVEKDGLMLRKYKPYGEVDWGRLRAIIAPIFGKEAFGVYDGDGDGTTGNVFAMPTFVNETTINCYPIVIEQDTYGYIVCADADAAKIAVEICKSYLENME